ncbi:MAG: OmpA family protein [Chitinispirillaceae bacterium]|nr:OmpA family protein [Chitinispirillaceae bacterium]
MMKTISRLCIMTVLSVAVAAAAAENNVPDKSAPAVADTSSISGGPEAMRTSLLDLRSNLKSAYQKYSPRDMHSINAYMTALARIEVTHRFLLENFNRNEGRGIIKYVGASSVENQARDMFEACSLLTEIAFVQMSRNELDGKLMEATRKSDSLHSELNQVYESIAEIERGRATDLKSRLDEESAKNKKLREDAERRFQKLQSKLIKVRKDARGTIISMSDLLFDFDKADLTADLKTALAKIAGILSVYKNCSVAVEGHTDNIGTAKYNKDLSARRASNVKDFLVEQGVEADRLSSTGYGFTKPVAKNSTKEGRQKNRRVDLVVIDKK